MISPSIGSLNFFAIADGSAIVTKQLQMDGTSKTVIYKPVDEKEVVKNTPKYITEKDLEDSLKKFNNTDLKEEIKSLKKQIKDMNRDIEDLNADSYRYTIFHELTHAFIDSYGLLQVDWNDEIVADFIGNYIYNICEVAYGIVEEFKNEQKRNGNSKRNNASTI